MQTRPEERSYAAMLAGLGLFTLLVGFIIMLVFPPIRLAAWAILALGVLLLAAAFIVDFRRVKGAITGRCGRFGTSITVMSSIFVGIILFVNAISVGSYHRFDVTALAQFTITPQTKEVLKNLSIPIQAIEFFIPNDQYGVATYANSLLTEYRNYTNMITVKTIDPDQHPDQARQYGITEYQSVVFESELGRRVVLGSDILEGGENAFTSAILEVTGVKQKKIYFLTGQGESDIDMAGTGYSQVRQALRDSLYQVEKLDLIVTPTIPADCAALIIAGPQEEMTTGELNIIRTYLAIGGWAVILLNPGAPSDIKQLVSDWGITVEDGTVIDATAYSLDKSSPSVSRDRNAFGLAAIYFPESLALVPQEAAQNVLTIIPLAYTGKDSWLARNYDPSQPPDEMQAGDLAGPLALAVLVTPTPPSDTSQQPTLPGTRLIIVGDSDFAADGNFYDGYNGDFFLNIVNTITMGKEIVSVQRKVLPFRRLIVGPEVQSFITYSSIGLLPLLVLVAGGVIWWRRR
ncbi:MAG: GldG family protein [Chloroflexota bacterium]